MTVSQQQKRSEPEPPGRPASPVSSSFFMRHWRGELSLPMAFFGVYLLGTVLAVVGMVVAVKTIDGPARADMFTLASLFAGTAVLPVMFWQIVGTWRSAARYSRAQRESGQSGWLGYSAQVVLVLGVVVLMLL